MSLIGTRIVDPVGLFVDITSFQKLLRILIGKTGMIYKWCTEIGYLNVEELNSYLFYCSIITRA